MNRKWLGLLAIPVVVSLVVAAPFLFSLFAPAPPPNGGGDIGAQLSGYMEGKAADILAVRIMGNSTDIVYPELMDALFVCNVTGEWIVSASFLNDSGSGPPLIYDEYFLTTLAEVEDINNAIYAGLEATSPSADSISELPYSVGFGLDILYEDGTWIQLFTLQSPTGHIIFLNGTYTGTPDTVNPFDSNYIQRDENWLNGILLEPGTALEDLVDTMYAVFDNHLG